MLMLNHDTDKETLPDTDKETLPSGQPQADPEEGNGSRLYLSHLIRALVESFGNLGIDPSIDP